MGKLGNRQCEITQYKTECIEKIQIPTSFRWWGFILLVAFHNYQYGDCLNDSLTAMLTIQ
ncbi:hypothetical protein A1Q3_03970 [Aliivibrio fischeri ZF-211]|nr:hypothetical protein A1Q3_03970 [Aliivibrio fischeri ZF-211]